MHVFEMVHFIIILYLFFNVYYFFLYANTIIILFDYLQILSSFLLQEFFLLLLYHYRYALFLIPFALNPLPLRAVITILKLIRDLLTLILPFLEDFCFLTFQDCFSYFSIYFIKSLMNPLLLYYVR